MLIQVIRGGIRVLLLDSSGFSMLGNLSLANRTKANTHIIYLSLCSFFNFVDLIVRLLLIATFIYLKK